MATYALYKKDTCPYCQRVLRFMANNNIQGVELKDILEDPKNKEYLIEHGGMNQVPCLFIDGKPMYESLDIIEYMKNNLLAADQKVNDDLGPEPNMCPFE